MKYLFGLLLALCCSQAQAQSGPTGGLPAGIIACNKSVVYDASANGPTQLVAAVTNQTIYICGYTLFAASAVNVELDGGAGIGCATGRVKIVPAFQLTAQTGVVDVSPFFKGLSTAQSAALCINTSAGVAVQAIIYFIQQ
jgi:hypothetical protein